MTNLSDKINYIESISNFDRATVMGGGRFLPGCRNCYLTICLIIGDHSGFTVGSVSFRSVFPTGKRQERQRRARIRFRWVCNSISTLGDNSSAIARGNAFQSSVAVVGVGGADNLRHQQASLEIEVQESSQST
jgi:hypothetical protein